MLKKEVTKMIKKFGLIVDEDTKKVGENLKLKKKIEKRSVKFFILFKRLLFFILKTAEENLEKCT